MNIRPFKITTIIIGFGAVLLSAANIVWASDHSPDSDQKSYQPAVKQDTSMPYLYVDLQNGEIIKTSVMVPCENTNGEGIKEYVEIPTGKVLQWNCRKR